MIGEDKRMVTMRGNRACVHKKLTSEREKKRDKERKREKESERKTEKVRK